MEEGFAGSSVSCASAYGCLGEEVAVAMAKCLEYEDKCHWGAIIGQTTSAEPTWGFRAPPTGKVHARSAERFIYGAWEMKLKTIPFKLFHNPSRLKSACSFSCCNRRPCLLGLAVETALAAAQNNDT